MTTLVPNNRWLPPRRSPTWSPRYPCSQSKLAELVLFLEKWKASGQILQKVPQLAEALFAEQGPIDEVVNAVKDAKSVLFLAAVFLHPLRVKGHSKLMEIAGIPWRLAYPAGEMKHGPIALLEEGSPAVVIAPNDSLKEKTVLKYPRMSCPWCQDYSDS